MTASLQRIIRLSELTQFCGLKRTQIHQLIKDGHFPAPVQLSARRKGWLEKKLIDWQQQRIARRQQNLTC
jgi:prophage regulatory protein